jgi:plastocyanin
VEIANFTFVGTATVSVGGTVTWTNTDDLEHDITAKTGAFNSEYLTKGKTYSRRFDSAGTFEYFCSIHPFMTGTVTVK